MKGNNLRMSVNRTPSLNDLMEGKPVEKKLPENFFEQVIDLELKLAKEFKMATVHELSNLFKQAIEYFESVGDPKFKDYTKRLNLLMADPKFLKFINKKSGDKDRSPLRESVIKKTHNYNVKTKTNDREHEKTVNQLVKDASKPANSLNIINHDLNKQSNSFRLRLEEKKKSKLASSFLNEDVETPTALNKSANLFDNSVSDIHDNDIIVDIEGSPKGFGFGVEEKSFSQMMNTDRRRSAMGIPNENFLKNNIIVSNIKEKVNDFLSEFNNYFSQNIFTKYTSHMEILMNEKFKKHLEICNYYDNQIKEMEFLLVDSEEMHRQSIYEIINNLKEEQKAAIEKNEETYKILMKDSFNKFQAIGFKENKHVKGFEQKFKIEIYQMVNQILNPK